MKKIKIRSNPYNKEIEYYSLNESTMQWENIVVKNPNSKLREERADTMFFPFRIDEIINIIRSDYYVGSEKVKVIFEGTTDEFNALKTYYGTSGVSDEIEIEKGDEYLEDARDVLKEIKIIFKDTYPVIKRIIDDSDSEVNKKLRKVTDALDDIVPICVFGNYSAGKSTFINALIGNEILPSGGDPVTAKIFKISPVNYEDRIGVTFYYGDKDIHKSEEEYEKYTILFYDDEVVYKRYNKQINKDVIKDDISDLNLSEKIKEEDFIPVLKKVSEYIGDNQESNKYQKASKALEIINNFERENDEGILLGNIIEIETPFSKDGILGQSTNKFVIFDTPGSNSASNKDHGEVLKAALDGFSNGIPVWVTQPDTIDSVDNATLCDLIQEIEALDKRFTLIIVNKADQADLPEGGFDNDYIKRIREYNSIEKMYAGGIFYVSSVMGLGSKNKEVFSSNYLRKTFKNNKYMFVDKDDEDYQQLFIYNILPKQMKDEICELSEKEENIIYANSGLLAVEEEMDTFATRHSSYNKCQMVELLFNNIIDKSNVRIEQKINVKDELKERENADLDEKKRNLINQMKFEADRQKDYIKNESIKHVKEYIRTNEYTKPDVDEVNKTDILRTEEEKEKINYDDSVKKYEETKKNKWANLVDNFSIMVEQRNPKDIKRIFNQFTNEYAEQNEQRKILRDEKNKVDDIISDEIIEYIKELYSKTITVEIEEIEADAKEKWEIRSSNFKNCIYRVVSENDDLSNAEKEEIKTIIDNYEGVKRKDNVTEIFLKNKFVRFLEKHKLDNRKLINGYVTNMENNIKQIANEVNNSYILLFDDWVERLLELIKTNITSYNKELGKIQERINSLTEEIIKLKDDQETMRKANDSIDLFISWKHD